MPVSPELQITKFKKKLPLFYYRAMQATLALMQRISSQTKLNKIKTCSNEQIGLTETQTAKC